MYIALAALDLALATKSDLLRSALGNVNRILSVEMLFRATPDLVLILFYFWLTTEEWRSVGSSARKAFASFVLLALLAVMSLVPWLGMWFAFLTPIFGIYAGAFLLAPRGLLVALTVGFAFSMLNLWLAVQSRRWMSGTESSV